MNPTNNPLFAQQTDRLIRIQEVQHLVGDVCKATIYNWMAQDDSFPKQINLGNSRIVAWSMRDIQQWIEKQKQKGEG